MSSHSGYCAVSGEFCEVIDVHHIVPREYGGEEGPTINLSPSIHQMLHRVYNDPAKLDAFANRFPRARVKILELAQILRDCKNNLIKMPPKKVEISLSKDEMQKLIDTANQMGTTPASVASSIVKRVLNG